MSGRPTYTDQDKARAFSLLEMNEGNVKRTARDLGMPISTLRRWRDEWDHDRMIPAAEDIIQSTGEFLEDAERVRDLSLVAIEAKIRKGEGTLAQLTTVVGVLDDKIARAKGLADRVTEHRITLPSRDEIVAALSGMQQSALAAAQQRQEEIVDAEVVEQKALPSAK
jgi:transposase-like protein